MKLLIVDDEPPARAKLRRLLADLPGISAVIEAGDATEALAKIAQDKPDAAPEPAGSRHVDLAYDSPNG